MQSLFNPKKRSSIALASAACMVAFTGGASANSVTLSQSPGLCALCGPNTYAVSSTFTVTVFANLGPDGGGQQAVGVSLTYDSSKVTALDCHEFDSGGILISTSPSPTFGQAVGTGVYVPFTPNCGAGSPADGGLLAGAGLVLGVEQGANTAFPAGTSGTLKLGTITFHARAPGTVTITTSLGGGGGFLGADFVNRTAGIPLGSLVVTVVPEPTTLALLGLGVLGLGLSSRRLRRR